MELVTNDINFILEALAIKIKEKIKDDDYLLLGIKNRGEHLAKRLLSILNKEQKNCSIRVSLYDSSLKQINDFPIISEVDINEDLRNKKVILIDDVFFTGRSVEAARSYLNSHYKAKEILVASLTLRPIDFAPANTIYGLFLDIALDKQIKVSIYEVDGKDEIVIV